MSRQSRGFTLIEVMIVVVVISILTALAVPAYERYAQRTRRSDAMNALQTAASRQERYFFQHNQYTDDVDQLGGSGGTLTSPEGYYTLTATIDSSNQSFTLTATPTVGGPQTKDSECTTLTIDEQGQRGATPSGNDKLCWNRK